MFQPVQMFFFYYSGVLLLSLATPGFLTWMVNGSVRYCVHVYLHNAMWLPSRVFTALHAERLVFQSGGKTLVRVTCKDADGDSEASQIQEFIPQWVSEIVAEVRAHAHFRELHHKRPAHMFAISHVCHQRLTSVLWVFFRGTFQSSKRFHSSLFHMKIPQSKLVKSKCF